MFPGVRLPEPEAYGERRMLKARTTPTYADQAISSFNLDIGLRAWRGTKMLPVETLNSFEGAMRLKLQRRTVHRVLGAALVALFTLFTTIAYAGEVSITIRLSVPDKYRFNQMNEERRAYIIDEGYIRSVTMVLKDRKGRPVKTDTSYSNTIGHFNCDWRSWQEHVCETTAQLSRGLYKIEAGHDAKIVVKTRNRAGGDRLIPVRYDGEIIFSSRQRDIHFSGTFGPTPKFPCRRVSCPYIKSFAVK